MALFCSSVYKMSIDECKKLALIVISWYPKSYNGKSYLTLRNWKKLFFSIFEKKYWLVWSQEKYSPSDIIRRIRLVEFFDYICSNFDIKTSDKNNNLIIETVFYRMVIKQMSSPKWTSLELLSFYHYK